MAPFVGWHVPYVSQETRVELLNDYRARLLNLESEAPLAFPSLDDFDELLYPLAAQRVAA